MSGVRRLWWSETENTTRVLVVYFIATNISIMPIEHVDGTIWSNFQTKSDPLRIICQHCIFVMFRNKTGAIVYQTVGQESMLVNIGHEKFVVIFLWKQVR